MSHQKRNVLVVLAAIALSACGSDSSSNSTAGTMAQALLVGRVDGQLISMNVADGATRPGAVPQALGPTDMQAMPEGYVGVNLGSSNEVLFVEARTMAVAARIPSSMSGNGKRPVHSYMSPTHDGKRYWLALNDGASPALADPVQQAATNIALLVGIAQGTSTWLKPVAEMQLGVGHHKAAFAPTRERVVISNISDCDKVFQVFDYSNPAAIQEVISWSAADLSATGFAFDCAATPPRRPSPHGCAPSSASGRVYCNLTGSGEIVSIDVAAATPTFVKISTGGTGSGATAAHPGGRYIFSAHNTPREGQGGVANQIGSLTIVDSQSDTAIDIPLLYDGAGGTAALVGTDEETANISHLTPSADGTKLFVSPGTGSAATARSRRVLLVDVSHLLHSPPMAPEQLASITVGASTGHNGAVVSGDGKLLFVPNNTENSVSVVDAATRQVVRTLDTHGASPKVVASFGTAEGCSRPVH